MLLSELLSPQRENTPWFEWTEEDTAEFISSLGRTERWHIHYSALVFRHDIDGHTLQRSSTDDLQDIGFTPRDANKVIKAFAKKVKLVGFPVEQSPSYKSKKRHRRKKKRRKRSRRHSRHSSDEN